MRLVLAVLLALLTGGALHAQNEATELTELRTALDARGWEAVGRLNIGHRGMCSGALIESNVVLTAGHCLFDKSSGEAVDPKSVTFLAGWRQGRAAAKRKVRRAVIHPDYIYSGETTNDTVPYDLAILELDAPIQLSGIQPFTVGPRPRKGSNVAVVSYGRDRADTASLQETCHVLARPAGTLVLSCEVDFGSSGAPVFAQIDGAPRIVSVISAMSSIRGRQVAFGTRLQKPLQVMRTMLAQGDVLRVEAPENVSAKRVKPGGPRVLRGGSGGKFVKP